MPIELLLGLCWMFIVHFICDFILQSDEMALNKSTSNKWLFYHILMYTAPFVSMIYVFKDMQITLLFMLINGILHFMTDYVSSRVAKYYWEKDDRHNFFVTVGADQLIHTMSLLCTFAWLYGG